jgi:hypothetical protein
MKDMKMKTVDQNQPDPVRFLDLAKAVLDNCGDILWDVLEEFHDSEGRKTQKFIRSILTKGEFSDSQITEFRSYLCDELRIIEALKGHEYASEEAGYAELLALSKARA